MSDQVASDGGLGGSRRRAASVSGVRRHNRRLILHALRVRGSLSRAELARATGLTPQAIANIVYDLISSGLLQEAGRRKTSRGQPPIAIEIAQGGGYALGIRIEATHFHAVAAELRGDLIEMREGAAPTGGDAGWFDLIAEIHAYFASRFGRERCLGLGLVMPGPFDTDWPGVPTPGAVLALQRRGVADELAARIGAEVFLENDALAAALGEKLYGHAVEIRDFFYVFVGEGVGGGIVIKDEPYRGNRGNAGEFGHVIIDPNGPQCYCGNRGCLGEYLSLAALRNALGAAALAGEEPDVALDRWLEQAAGALAIGLVSIENLFDPECIIIGGTAPASLLEKIVDRLGEFRPSVRQDLGRQRVRISALGEQSSSLGASALPILAATSTGQPMFELSDVDS